LIELPIEIWYGFAPVQVKYFKLNTQEATSSYELQIVKEVKYFKLKTSSWILQVKYFKLNTSS